MTRLIDVDAVYKWYLEAFKGRIKPNEIRFSINDIRDNLQNIPTIDAEPVRHRLEKSDAGMTVSEYRERMIQAFHNADCDSLIAVVVLPTEKEFQHLEWLLKKEYVPFLEKAKRLLPELWSGYER